MGLKKLPFQPGIVRANSDYAEPGRYIDAQWVRFVAGLAQKMGGFVRAIPSANPNALTGVCRNIAVWRDNQEIVRAAFGTHSKLILMDGGTLVDVTPFRGRNTGNLSGALTTVNGSVAVTVAHTAHQQKAGDWVTLTAGAAVGGLTIAGNFVVQTVPGANSYTIAATAQASSSASGGGTIAYVYYRLPLGANPFATVSGSPVVTVTDASNSTINGDTVIFDGAAAVAGITLSGAYAVGNALPGSYTVTAGNNANATTAGGGSAVTVQNEINIGLIDSIQGQGFGVGPYSDGGFGTPRPAQDVTLMARVWSLWAYGEWLLACPRLGGLYLWDRTIGGRAIGLYRAPATQLGFWVTAERYIISFGKDGDTLNLGWPDQTDPTNWTVALGNTANSSRHIQGGNFIMGGAPLRPTTNLIWTDTSAFLHQWQASDYVFTTNKMADGCGLFGPNAWAVAGEAAYWISDGQFWKWDGALAQVPSDDIRDFFFADVDHEQRAKVAMGTIGQFNELIVLYQHSGGSEVDRYLLFNWQTGVWSTGSLARTAWIDKGLIPTPMAADSAGAIWNHETGLDGNGAAIDAWVTGAPVDIDDGEENMDILAFWPDLKGQSGNLSLYILTRQLPADTPVSDGPYALAAGGLPADVRSSGKMAGFKLESNAVGGNFRMGICRVDVQPAGNRR